MGFEYLETPGVLTEKCFPYTSENGVVPTCPSTCVQGKWKRYRCIPGSTVQVYSSEEIRHEIYNNGPVVAGFLVYTDFLNYKSGIYKYTEGEFEFGHFTRMVGWG